MVSKTRVDKAGELLRTWWITDTEGPIPDNIASAVNDVWEYRTTFQYPMTKINANLRHYVKQSGSDVIIAQRLKRLPRILDKMVRQSRMRLSQMQDVGGCRAVLPDEQAVRDVLDGIERNWDVITIDDYITAPKESGYRAIHAIVRRDATPIEVQLRTTGQQDWADEIERIDGKTTYSLKDGEGPAEVIEYTRILSQVIAASESGLGSPQSALEELARLRTYLPS